MNTNMRHMSDDSTVSITEQSGVLFKIIGTIFANILLTDC